MKTKSKIKSKHLRKKIIKYGMIAMEKEAEIEEVEEEVIEEEEEEVIEEEEVEATEMIEKTKMDLAESSIREREEELKMKNQSTDQRNLEPKKRSNLVVEAIEPGVIEEEKEVDIDKRMKAKGNTKRKMEIMK